MSEVREDARRPAEGYTEEDVRVVEDAWRSLARSHLGFPDSGAWIAAALAALAGAGRLRTAGDDKAIRERDSLTRRLSVRFGELEEARAALRQMTDERDAARAGRLLPEDTRTEWAWDCRDRPGGHFHRGPEDWVKTIAPKMYPGGCAVWRTPAGPWVPVEPEPDEHPDCVACQAQRFHSKHQTAEELRAELAPLVEALKTAGPPRYASEEGPCA